ncbi:nucleotidyltransferase [Microbacteriaceae bacterium 4G12]
MKAAGVIVEYNPFHNGHAYHLQQTKKLTHANILIAVMSGPFLQRGEPALVSKWARTKMALEGGADIIVELPYAFATQKAETFASGAISILDALGVEEICFGSENGNIDQFLNTIYQQQTFQDAFNDEIQKRMKEGISYPKALSSAFAAIKTDIHTVDMSQPNNILGFHYIQAILKQGSKIVPKTVTRLSSQYHDEAFASATIASATSIRKHIQAHSIETIEGVIPTTTFLHLMDYCNTYGLFHDWEKYFTLFKYTLLTATPRALQRIYEAEEGLEYRVLSSIRTAPSFAAFMESIKTKRYTWTRLQRFCLHILTQTTKEQLSYAQHGLSPYIRLLGMSKKGQAYLSQQKKQLSLPLVSNLKAFSHPLLELDQKASAVYFSILPEPLRSQMLKADFVQHPLRYDEDEKTFV